jgi:hypothetical protein
VFERLLGKYYGSVPDDKTLRLLRALDDALRARKPSI